MTSRRFLACDTFCRVHGYQRRVETFGRSVLHNNARFRTCFLNTSSSQFKVALARNGYATDPIYSHKLNATIRAHKLDQYDKKWGCR